MEIRVILDPMSNQEVAQTGGGYGNSLAEVHVDANMDAYNRRETVTHEILEQFLWFLPHDAIDQLTEAVMEGLEQVENVH